MLSRTGNVSPATTVSTGPNPVGKSSETADPPEPADPPVATLPPVELPDAPDSPPVALVPPLAPLPPVALPDAPEAPDAPAEPPVTASFVGAPASSPPHAGRITLAHENNQASLLLRSITATLKLETELSG
jgi:hypothetical protein